MPKSKNHIRPNKTANPIPPESRPVEVDFVLEFIGAGHVYISGDFNDWQPTSLRMIGYPEAGLWEKRLVLPPGRYEYKFLVDGTWLHDPEAAENVPNIFGSLNSVVLVKSTM